MDPNTGEKKYGLIIPSKNKGLRSAFLSNTSEPKRVSKVFDAESSSDDNLEEDEDDEKPQLDWRARTVAKTAEKSMQRNQARQAALKALAEDPTVFEYDEVYDDMQQKKEEKKPPKEERKPKYIANLLKTAELRKVETERRVERKVQKERETEGDMFSDKEAFVTPAYRAKLAELKKLEEEERIREMREAALDVTKQGDLSGFYRHLYKQTFAEDQPKKEEPEEPVTFKKESVETETKSRRQYRSRREEEEEEEEAEEEQQQEVEREPSPEASSKKVQRELPGAQGSSDTTGKSKEDRRPAATASLVSAAATDRAAAAERAADKTVPAAKPTSSRRETDSESDERSSNSPSPEPEVLKPKVKVDIWKKRTVGHLYDEAVERYLARKEAREQMMTA